jgi:hypothetical protein
MPKLIAAGLSPEEAEVLKNENHKRSMATHHPTKAEKNEDLPAYPVKTFCWFVVNYPFTVMTVTFVISVSLASLGAMGGGEFGGSFTDLNDVVVKRMFGMQRAVMDW